MKTNNNIRQPANRLLSIVLALLASCAVFLPNLGAQGLNIDLGLDQTTILAGKSGTAFLKIGLEGAIVQNRQRPMLNVAIVLDRSGSMEGEKLRRAKEAALYALTLLRADDMLSLVVYDTEVAVLVPAGKLGDGRRFRKAIEEVEAGSSTALFAGVSRGAGEVRKFLERNQVNRVILLSDGLANVGPDSPASLGELGTSLRREGMSVSTIGLGDGYNEDLMSRLAMASDGNHAFVQEPRDLVRVFDAEFKDALSIAAVDIRIRIDLGPGVKPKRIMNREGNINGSSIELNMNQVLSSQEKYILVELELPSGTNGQSLEVAKAQASYRSLGSSKEEQKSAKVAIRYSSDQSLAKASVRKDVKEQVILQQATEANESALRLRDEGKTEEAKSVLKKNSEELMEAAREMQSPALSGYAEKNKSAADNMDKEDWNVQRKGMRAEQYQNKTQQSY